MRIIVVILACLHILDVSAQQVADPGFPSNGRGAPLVPAIPGSQRTPAELLEAYPPAELENYPEQYWMVGPFRIGTLGAGGVGMGMIHATALDGSVPEGIEPLPVDLFTSNDFYADRELWSDPRYFRCNSSEAIQAQWSGLLIGDDPPASAAWGYCDRDYPRAAIVSPYSFANAMDHYNVLMEEAKYRGGPTQHTYSTVPSDWNGRYVWPRGQNWYAELFWSQVPTVLSLMTEEYQTRFVQEAYHHGNTNAPQWQSQYCWPEGFTRRFHEFAVWEHYFTVTPNMVQIVAGVARNFITNIHIGREFNTEGVVPRLGEDVPRWYGETIGFWDGDALITWTSNIQGWKNHAAPEHSSKMQTIEIYTPNHDDAGNFTGLNHETIFYDPEVWVKPVRIVRNLQKQNDYDDPDATPYVFVECIQSIFPIDGRATPVSHGQVIEYEIPDMYGRPWAHYWDQYFEQDMEKPEEEDIFSFE